MIWPDKRPTIVQTFTRDDLTSERQASSRLVLLEALLDRPRDLPRLSRLPHTCRTNSKAYFLKHQDVYQSHIATYSKPSIMHRSAIRSQACTGAMGRHQVSRDQTKLRLGSVEQSRIFGLQSLLPLGSTFLIWTRQQAARMIFEHAVS